MSSLRARLMAIFLVSAVLVVTGTAFAGDHLLSTTLGVSDAEEAEQDASFVALAIDSLIDDIDNVAEATEARERFLRQLSGGDRDGLAGLLSSLVRSSELGYALVLDADGEILARGHESIPDTSEDGALPGRSASRLGIKERGLLLQPNSGVLAFSAVPVREPQAPFTQVGTLVLGRRLDSDFATRLAADLDVHLSIISNGARVFSTEPQLLDLPTEEVTLDGTSYVTSTLSLSRWDVTTVFVEIANAQTETEIAMASYRRVLLLAGAASAAAGLLLAALLATSIISPLTHLEENMSRFGRERSFRPTPTTHAPREIRSLGSTFGTMARQIVDGDEAVARLKESRTRFIQSVAHEVRTPLAAIMGYAEVLNEGIARSEEQEQFLDIIAQEADNLGCILDDLFTVDAPRAEMISKPEATDLHDLAERTIRSLPIELAAGREITLSGSQATAWADPRRTRQVLRNLLTNAAKYGGDTITVSTRTEAHKAIISVHDNGDGVSPELHGRLFEAYSRSGQDPGLTDSMGLGLYVSHRLTSHMGGSLTYRRESSDTVFELSLPAALPDAESGVEQADVVEVDPAVHRRAPTSDPDR